MSTNDNQPPESWIPFGFDNLDRSRLPHASELPHRKDLRRGIREANFVVAVWPDKEEVLFGGDYLTHQQALGETEIRGGLLLRVETEAHINLVVQALVNLRPQTVDQIRTMIENTASVPRPKPKDGAS